MTEIYRVARITPAAEAMRWDGSNTSEIIHWAQGGWKDDGIWIKQTFPEGAKNPAWVMILNDRYEVPVGGWIVKHGNSLLFAGPNDDEFWGAYAPLDARVAA